MSFEIRSKPMKVRFTKGETSQHCQVTVPIEVRKRFEITPSNEKSLVFIVKGNGRVEVECLEEREQPFAPNENPPS